MQAERVGAWLQLWIPRRSPQTRLLFEAPGLGYKMTWTTGSVGLTGLCVNIIEELIGLIAGAFPSFITLITDLS